jgi:hypothetical protein
VTCPQTVPHIENINNDLVSYKKIKGYDLTDKEMEKTTTLKIKRRTVITEN